ncbi:MAG: transcriptional regulator, MarR family [Firmicutes bacterium]|nr:transcriptional regulator, MarR family [Bacillota bacterium]
MNKDVKLNKYLRLFSLSWKINKLYEKKFRSILAELQLTQSEADVLLFLYNNKLLDTAKDIAEYRALSKSLISKSVDSLLTRGYLSSEIDPNDKRSIRLKIEPAAIPIVKKLKSIQKSSTEIISRDITLEETKVLVRILNKVHRNIADELEE